MHTVITMPIPLNKLQLVCHPDSQNPAIQSLTVTLDNRLTHSIRLTYQLTADIKQLIIPKPQTPVATDGLWQHSCFELFIAKQHQSEYLEFNFSPSGLWAAYAFSGYRQLEQWTTSSPPHITTEIAENSLILIADIRTKNFPANPDQAPLQVGLTAVLENHDHSCSYWALRHPVKQPDFHHRDSFACILENL